jgi:hypothetical protein
VNIYLRNRFRRGLNVEEEGEGEKERHIEE